MSTAVYTRYELLRVIRNKRVVIFSLAFPVILYLAIVAPNRDVSNFSGTGLSTALYFMVGLASFATMNAMLASGGRIAADRAAGWNRQLRVSPLSPSAYIGTKVLTGVPAGRGQHSRPVRLRRCSRGDPVGGSLARHDRPAAGGPRAVRGARDRDRSPAQLRFDRSRGGRPGGCAGPARRQLVPDLQATASCTTWRRRCRRTGSFRPATSAWAGAVGDCTAGWWSRAGRWRWWGSPSGRTGATRGGRHEAVDHEGSSGGGNHLPRRLGHGAGGRAVQRRRGRRWSRGARSVRWPPAATQVQYALLEGVAAVALATVVIFLARRARRSGSVCSAPRWRSRVSARRRCRSCSALSGSTLRTPSCRAPTRAGRNR